MQSINLESGSASVCLLSSDEPLLIGDWLDDARSKLKQSGFEDIQSFSTDTSFNWDDLIYEGDAMSLFAEKKCRILRVANGKPGQQGGKVIQALCDDPQDDSVFIFVLPKLDRSAKNSSWYKRLQKAGQVVELKPVYSNELVDWILQRAGQKSLNLDSASAAFLAERTEGNLLAADQELEKLSMRFAGKGDPDFAAIEASVAQSARYSHFVLVDACLAGNSKRAMKVLNSLIAEGYVTTQLLWALQSTLQQLAALKQAQTGGRINPRAWQELRIWSAKQRLFERALGRLGLDQIERLLQSCATLDRIGKGQQFANFVQADWLQMKSILGEFCGIKPIES